MVATPTATWEDIRNVEHELVSVTVAAVLLGVSGVSVHRRIKAGQLQTVKFGREIFLRRSDVLAIAAA